MSSFRDKIKAALVESLHTDPLPALYFIENFPKFQKDIKRTENWELELAVREIYKNPLPFVWSEWEDYINPTMSYEYEMNHRHVAHIEKLCLFIKEIEHYIN